MKIENMEKIERLVALIRNNEQWLKELPENVEVTVTTLDKDWFCATTAEGSQDDFSDEAKHFIAACREKIVKKVNEMKKELEEL